MVLGTQEGDESSLPEKEKMAYLPTEQTRRLPCRCGRSSGGEQGLKGGRSGRRCREPEEVKETNEIGSRIQITWFAS